ncbi:MAG: flagellar hook-associated protein FlgL [Rhodospirillaceae bacterium]
MRISTNLIYQQGVSGMQRQQTELAKTQRQMSLGTRLLSPSDDPVAAARVLVIDQASATNDQYEVNRGAARSALGLEESVLTSVGDLLQQVRTTAIYAGNGTLTNSDRAALVTELKSHFAALMGLANATDGTGQYLFSGYQGATQPFSGAIGAVQYNGDQGQRLVQAGPSRQLPISDAGSDVFEGMRTGNGAFLAQAGNGTADDNTGSGIIGPGSVVNAASLTGHSYAIRFTVSAGVTTYDVVDTTTNTAVAAPAATGNIYTSGAAIAFDGMQVEIGGAPANGDEFSITPSRSQSVFKTLSDLISAIGTPVPASGDTTRLANAIGVGIKNIDQALDKVSSVRADIGARMQELDSLDQLGENVAVEYAKTKSELTDLDYAAAASDLTRQQLIFEAAQKSFAKIAGMSLFDFF